MVQISDLDVAHMRSQKLSLVLYGGWGSEAPSHLVRRLNAEDGMTFSTQRVEITEKTANRGPARGPRLFAPLSLFKTQMHVFFAKRGLRAKPRGAQLAYRVFPRSFLL